MRPTTTDTYYLDPEIVTQGNTGSATRVKITAKDASGNRVRTTNPLLVRCRICNDGVLATSTNATIAVANGSTLGETITSNKDITAKSSVGAAATGTLTISGGAKHLETVVIGPRTYKFDATGELVAGDGEYIVDISAVTGLAAADEVLVIAEPVTAGDTMTIGSKAYLFVGNGLANTDGEISIGDGEATTKLNIVKAILGTDGFNTEHPDVTCAAAFSSDNLTITAKIKGTIGNAIALSETFTHGSNIWTGAATALSGGTDPSAANSATALRTAINADGGAVVTAGGTSGTVSVTAVAVGTSYNSYATTDTMANGSWGAGTLGSGSDDEPELVYVDITDASAETVTLRVGIAPVGGVSANCSKELDITHAAP